MHAERAGAWVMAKQRYGRRGCRPGSSGCRYAYWAGSDGHPDDQAGQGAWPIVVYDLTRRDHNDSELVIGGRESIHRQGAARENAAHGSHTLDAIERDLRPDRATTHIKGSASSKGGDQYEPSVHGGAVACAHAPCTIAMTAWTASAMRKTLEIRNSAKRRLTLLTVPCTPVCRTRAATYPHARPMLIG